jgi:beta-1,4-mannosyl-glycoprotein beta-1,4-N-acetylglucosaminyltransferase
MIYDCFTFNNETDILYFRLRHLWNYVDKFVIVEANMTHRGILKDWNFSKVQQDFEWAKDKIEYIQVNLNFGNMDMNYKGDSYNPNSPFMILDNQQRNGIMYGLLNANNEDIIMISDLDEFPNYFAMDMIYDLTDIYPYFTFGMRSFCYYLNVIQNDVLWKGTVVGKRKNLFQPQIWRAGRWDIPWEGWMGYHFSWIGKDNVKNKFKNTAHDEVHLYDNQDHIDKCFQMKEDNTFGDLFGRDIKSSIYDMESDPYYPRVIIEEKDKFSHLFYK